MFPVDCITETASRTNLSPAFCINASTSIVGWLIGAAVDSNLAVLSTVRCTNFLKRCAPTASKPLGTVDEDVEGGRWLSAVDIKSVSAHNIC